MIAKKTEVIDPLHPNLNCCILTTALLPLKTGHGKKDEDEEPRPNQFLSIEITTFLVLLGLWVEKLEIMQTPSAELKLW